MPKIRFLKTTTNYPNYTAGLISKHPEIKGMNYDDALRLYFSDCNSWADFWKINLEATGKFECCEIIENAELLQKKWAAEHNIKFSEGNWKEEILIEQIRQFKPDVLFLVDQYGDNSLSAKIKRLVPGIKLILGWDGILWHKAPTFENTDIVLTCVPETVDFYKALGKKVYYHKFGFETTILDKLSRFPKQHEVSFAGSLILNENYHMNRLKLVAELSRKVNMNIFASSLPDNWSLLHRYRLMNTIKTGNWNFAFDLQRVGGKNKGSVFGLDMFNVLYNSKIVFNTHGDNSIKTAPNMRMTEATGVGSLLLTDWKENLHELFVPDEELVTYKTGAEAVDKIKSLLNNEALRTKIAKKGQERTLRDCSYKKRMDEFANFIVNYL